MLPGLLLLVYSCGEVISQDARPPVRVGQIFVTGNTVLPELFIVSHVPLYPGKLLTYPDLQAADKRLAWLAFFGFTTMVAVIDTDGPNPFKDILVSVDDPPLLQSMSTYLQGRKPPDPPPASIGEVPVQQNMLGGR